jgi:hypothetical protein
VSPKLNPDVAVDAAPPNEKPPAVAPLPDPVLDSPNYIPVNNEF